MTERKLSQLQKEYRDFFLEKLSHFGVLSPAQLTKERKSIFFTSIKKDWKEIKFVQKQAKDSDEKVIKLQETLTTPTKRENHIQTPTEKTSNQEIHKRQEQKIAQQVFAKEIIKSEPNKEQTDDLKILFIPNNHFVQSEEYLYPVVKMPQPNSPLKLPRMGRSNQKGHEENRFFNEIKLQIHDIELTNNVHMVIPNYNKPYEPDIVLFEKNLNLYIDVEIDEPYDGFYRYPTHNYRAEDHFKQDNIRDLYFNESGWVVIRFTEKQVHVQPKECIDYIKNVINSLYGKESNAKPKCEIEYQWNENQSIQWQLNRYREKYLDIPSFYKVTSHKEVLVADQEYDSIEAKIQRTLFEDIEKQYDKDLHKYFHPKDKTGNAEYLSVTTLVERFFQFDILLYTQREAEKQNRDEEEVFRELQTLRDEAAVLGTELHLQIENYFTKKPFDDSLKEFKYFLNFEKEKIIPKGLTFTEAEKKIFYYKYNVAGTVDCLLMNSEGKYVMVDWKRSKKLIIKGTDKPDKRGFQIEIDGLSTLTNCSYYRYCIQQNIYKYILEKEYNIEISEMILAVLHENYPTYHTIKLPEMANETETIFKSINHKI